ncbi:MAG: hypothetical protein PF636_05690 [Actinomycetota bacterium]|nr:hypothetical protein [Actinomycetota bacterium]
MVESNESVEPDSKESSDRSVRTLATVILLVIVIIVVLLLWRSCDATGKSDSDSGGGGVVESVEGLSIAPGDVAIWLNEGASIDDVLARHNLSADGMVAFDDGTTFVIPIGDADSEDLVAELKKDVDLMDAGYLYVQE